MAKGLEILVRDVNLGGISDSSFQGADNSVASCYGLDLHSEPGIIKAQYRLIKDTDNDIDQLIKSIVHCTNGEVYFFGSSNGKIWRRITTNDYFLEATDANGAIYSACEFEGYIYYASQTKLGRWQIGTAWSTRNDSWATFTNGAAAHPMHSQNQVLYIGDGYLVAQVESGVFTANALDLETKHTITALARLADDLVIGTTIGSTSKCNVFTWDTYSVSFSGVQEIPDKGVNAFVVTDSALLIQAGERLNFYSFARDRVLGTFLQRYKRIPGTYDTSNKGIVYAGAGDNFFGLPLFGISGVAGAPAKIGVYSLGGYASNYPGVLALEYALSQSSGGDYDGMEIGALRVVGSTLYVAWKDGATYGVDTIDFTTRGTGAFETRVYNFSRDLKKRLKAYIPYKTDGTVQLDVRSAYSGYQTMTLVKDEDRHVYYTQEALPEGTTMQARVTIGGTAEIEGVEFYEIV